MNSVTIRNLLVRGMLAGLAAGALALVVAYLLGEPQVDAAIAFEEAHSHEHEMEVVSRGVQSTAGLATGVLVYGVALGGIAALAFCFALGRIGRFGARATAALLSGAALLAVYLVPFLKYPANPPSVGDPDTIGKRTALYFLMMLLGILLAVAATILGRRLAPKLGNWYAAVAGRRRLRGRHRPRLCVPAGRQRGAARLLGHAALAVPAVGDHHSTGAVDRLRAGLRPPRGAGRADPVPGHRGQGGTRRLLIRRYRGRARDAGRRGPFPVVRSPWCGPRGSGRVLRWPHARGVPPRQDRPGMPSRCGRSWSRRSRLARR
ncbi:Probable cobalt transporter subunit (CbtA) [Streptomyces sp. KS_16]|nr:Probable cobalt transporter subunit (CbtA) [Streptomyces sp. KS_16]